MAKLTNKHKQYLNSILADLNKAQTYLMKDTTVVAYKMNITAMPVDTFINKATNDTYIQGNKHIGSELCYLHNAIRSLNTFLESE